MGRAVRRQLFETLNTLKEANQLIEKMLEAAQINELLNMLTDCQNCAIAIGTRIDSVYEEGLESVHSLERYYEALFELSQCLNDIEKRQELYRQLIELLLQVETNIIWNCRINWRSLSSLIKHLCVIHLKVFI